MLDFQIQDKDTGINDADSIQPYDNSEDADQTVFRRTPENLRTRSEVIRKALDNALAVASLDRGMSIVATPETTIAWGGASDVNLGSGNGTGIPTLDAPVGPGTGAVKRIAVQSMLSNAKLLDSGGNWVIGDTAIMPKLARTDSGETLTFTSLKRPWENGGNIFIRMYDSGSSQVPKAIATVDGTLDGSGNPSGPVTIDISLSNGGGGIDATHQDVINAITGTAATLVSVASTLTTATAFEIKDGTDPLKGVPLEGGVDSESFAILETNWNAFFTGDNLLKEGDVLVFTFPDAEARRKQGGSPESTLRVMRNSENVDNSSVVPIAKVIQDQLIFINGTVVQRGETIRLAPDQHLRSDLADDTDPDTGDRLVGADAKTGGGANLAQGTVYSQLLSLLTQHGTLEGEYDAHVAGSADNHTIGQITAGSRPFVVVDPDTGDGDYTTIQAALTALGSTGGTILVKSGTYAPVTLNGAAGDIFVIGESKDTGSDGVIIETTDGTDCLFDDSGHPGKVVFRNIQFYANSAAATYGRCVGLEDNGPVHFENCFFNRSHATPSTTESILLSRRPDVRFTNCRFQGQQGNSAPCILFFNDTSDQTRVVVDHCRFDDWDIIVEYGKSGEEDTGYELVFRHNQLYDCGYSSGAGSYTTLIKRAVSTTELRQVDISHNQVFDSGTANRQARFCDLKGCGTISNNILSSPISTASTAAEYMMTVEGISTAGQIEIVNNNFPDGNLAGAASLGGFSVFRNNVVQECAPSDDGPVVYVSGDGDQVLYNRIIHDDTSTSTRAIIYVDSATDVRIESNLLEGCYRNDAAIYLYRLCHRAIVARNTAIFKTDGATSFSSYGVRVVVVGAEYPEFGQVIDNVFQNVREGFRADHCNDWNISGNQFDMENTSVVSCTGVYIDVNSSRCRVVNNRIYFPTTTATGTYGISFSCPYMLIANNQIYSVGQGIVGTDANSTQFVIQGNQIHLNNHNTAIGVDVSHASQTTLDGAIVGNYVNAGTGSTQVAFDLEGAEEVGVGGNVCVPFNAFAQEFKTDGNSGDLGMMRNPASVADIDDHNFWTQTV